jgi:hypothetical protein
MRVAAELPSRRNRPDTAAGAPPRWLVIVSLVWIAAIAGMYYRRAWGLLLARSDVFAWPEVGQGLLSTGLPFAGEALQRGVAALAAATVIVIALLSGGRVLDRWLMPPSLRPVEQWAVRFANGAGAWSLVFFTLALCGAYRPAIVRFLLIVVACAGTTAMLARNRPRRLLSWAAFRLSRPVDRIWQFVVLAAAVTAFLTALAPEVEYDALWYHLELPRRWLTAGRPVDDLTEYISLYPLTWNLIYGGALALDGAPAAKLLHWTAYLASGVVAASIAERALAVRSRPLAAAVFLTAPTVLWEATTAYVDLAVALHVGIGAGALWLATRDSDRRWMWLAGTHLGLGCATKHLALVPATIALALAVAFAWRQGRGGSTLRRLVPVVLLTFALPSPWYARSFAASGNPVFPEMYDVFGAEPPERWDRLTARGLAGFKAHFGAERTAIGLATLPWEMTMHGWKYGGTLGPLVLLLLPCVVAVCRRSAAARWLTAGLLLYAAIWASPLSSFQLRFLVPWWLFASGLVTLAAERLVEDADRGARPLGALVVAVLAAVLVTNLPPFTPVHEGDRAGWDRWLTHVVRRVPIEVVAGGIPSDQWLRTEVRTFGAWTYLNTGTAQHARVLTFFGGDHFYSQRRRLWSEAVIARPVTWGATDVRLDELLSRLDALGITHVMAPPPHRQTADQKALTVLQAETLTVAFERVYQDEWTVIYRRRPASSGRDDAPAAVVEPAGTFATSSGRTTDQW